MLFLAWPSKLANRALRRRQKAGYAWVGFAVPRPVPVWIVLLWAAHRVRRGASDDTNLCPDFVRDRRPDAGLRWQPAMRALGTHDRICRTQKIVVLLEALASEGGPTGPARAGGFQILTQAERRAWPNRTGRTVVADPDRRLVSRRASHSRSTSMQTLTRVGRGADPVECGRDSRGGRAR